MQHYHDETGLDPCNGECEEFDCCCLGNGHEEKCCPGWAHFNEEQMPDGRIISDIECCDDCAFAKGEPSDDEAALAAHDAACKLCRPLMEGEDFDFLPGYSSPEMCRITKRSHRRGTMIVSKMSEEDL